MLFGDTAADVADAERAVERLQREARSLADSEAVARLLLRAEAVASSRIEGLEVGSRRLLKAQVALGLGDDPRDVTATEVLNNVEAMRWATEAIADAEKVTVEHLLEIHRRLMVGTRLEHVGGRVRDEQNWIGGSSYNPCSAAFVPPPPERVGELLADLCAFCNDDDLPAVAQAAIAHAQFETIHPFVDGNGRTGRALIHVLLKRRGLATTVVPPMSLVLATLVRRLHRRAHRDALTQRAGHPPRPSTGSTAGSRCSRPRSRVPSSDADDYERQVHAIQARWREAVGKLRSDSAVFRLIERCPVRRWSPCKAPPRSSTAASRRPTKPSLTSSTAACSSRRRSANATAASRPPTSSMPSPHSSASSPAPTADTRLSPTARTVPVRPR